MSENFSIINRSAIILIPQQPFFDWLFNVEIKIHGVNNISKEEVLDDYNVYLIKEIDLDEDLDKYLRKNFKKFFLIELSGWYTDESMFPKIMNYNTFKEWFKVQASSMVIDSEKIKIDRDEY